MKLFCIDFSLFPDDNNVVVCICGRLQNEITACLQVSDFKNYFWLPNLLNDSSGNVLALKRLINSDCAKSSQDFDCVDDIVAEKMTPIMYYRPECPGCSKFLKVTCNGLQGVKTASNVIERLLEEGKLSEFQFEETVPTIFEGSVAFLTRFMVDKNMSGGCWVDIDDSMLIEVEDESKLTSCCVEYSCSAESLHGLNPDILTESLIPSHQETPFLKTCSIFVVQQSEELIYLPELLSSRLPPVVKSLCTSTPIDNASNSSCFNPTWDIISCGPILAISVSSNQRGDGALASPDVIVVDSDDEDDEGDNTIIRSVRQSKLSTIVFILIPSQSVSQFHLPSTHGNLVMKAFCTEDLLIRSFLDFFHNECDPDVVIGFDLGGREVRIIEERARSLGIAFELGRLKFDYPATSPTRESFLKACCHSSVRKVITYSKNWVKKQLRMTAISNLATFKVIRHPGRLCLDLLRYIVTNHKMDTFSFCECVSKFLNEAHEEMSDKDLNEQWLSIICLSTISSDLRNNAPFTRLCYWLEKLSFRIHQIFSAANIINEAIELSKIAGLTIEDAVFKAQMVRTWSLLLRAAKRSNYIVGGPTDSREISLDSSPFLYHPRDNHTAGLYRDPVIVLDFASLYPSLFIAHNLCYSTLLHSSGKKKIQPCDKMESPTSDLFPVSDCFVNPSIREGIFPRILKALIRQRKATKDELATEMNADKRMVLESRQLALKVCANAAYGFTGSNASPLQCMALAETCLRLGHYSCLKAMDFVNDYLSSIGGRVIYGQTDSLMILVPGKSPHEAVNIGINAASYLSTCFPSPMSVKFERVLCPFLLDITNFYSGVEYRSEDASRVMPRKRSDLLIRGFASERRNEPMISRNIVKELLDRLLFQNDFGMAVNFVSDECRRLLAGDVSIRELTVTKALWRVDESDIENAIDGLIENSDNEEEDSDSEDSKHVEVSRGKRKANAHAASQKKPRRQIASPHSPGISTSQAHVAVAQRLKLLFPKRRFRLGERIPHVFLLGDLGNRQADTAEDPTFALVNGFQLNYQLYWTNKVKPHVERLMRYFYETPAGITRNSSPSVSLSSILDGPHTKIQPKVLGKAAMHSRVVRTANQEWFVNNLASLLQLDSVGVFSIDLSMFVSGPASRGYGIKFKDCVGWSPVGASMLFDSSLKLSDCGKSRPPLTLTQLIHLSESRSRSGKLEFGPSRLVSSQKLTGFFTADPVEKCLSCGSNIPLDFDGNALEGSVLSWAWAMFNDSNNRSEIDKRILVRNSPLANGFPAIDKQNQVKSCICMACVSDNRDVSTYIRAITRARVCEVKVWGVCQLQARATSCHFSACASHTTFAAERINAEGLFFSASDVLDKFDSFSYWRMLERRSMRDATQQSSIQMIMNCIRRTTVARSAPIIIDVDADDSVVSLVESSANPRIESKSAFGLLMSHKTYQAQPKTSKIQKYSKKR